MIATTKRVRTRFAPSPTGGLHLGGVRTALFSYLYAAQHGGDFILRVEDTDQSRYVEGAEQYIIDCLTWCGIPPAEGPQHGGPYAPYRQSERKNIYGTYAKQLVDNGFAYYAFDTPDELDQMRLNFKTAENPSPQYDHHTRMHMKNSLVLSKEVVQQLLEKNTPYVIRILMPSNEVITFHDMIRGEIRNDSNLVDDKVLLKGDGMPTYHLAVVVDDYLMKITHAFRGEEWLPSAPVHIKLWEYLGWKEDMPEWAHLPLILKPDGHGKLSKRDGDRLGFPVFAMDWKDPQSGETTTGFRERGFLPEAFLNMLALLGWHSGEEKEIYSLSELTAAFRMERVHKGGAKFDFEKAKYFNHEWIKRTPDDQLIQPIQNILQSKGIDASNTEYLKEIIPLVKERAVVLNDFYEQCFFFYQDPTTVDTDTLKAKWDEIKSNFFKALMETFATSTLWTATEIEHQFKTLAADRAIKVGELQLPFRIMLVGAKYGPGVFVIAEKIGREATLRRINHTLTLLG
jgi:glutamyl-tRNA synthetase